MLIDLDNLPSDPALLQRLVRDMAVAVDQRKGEIERLQAIIKKLQRLQFGRRAERLDAHQFELALEDLDGDIARVQEAAPVIKLHPGRSAIRGPITCRAKTGFSMSITLPAPAAAWVGGACWWLEALHDRLAKNVLVSDYLFADDTPV